MLVHMLNLLVEWQNWGPSTSRHLELVIAECGDGRLQAAGLVLCLGQLGSELLVEALQLAVVYRLLEQLLLHLPLQLLQCSDLHCAYTLS